MPESGSPAEVCVGTGQVRFTAVSVTWDRTEETGCGTGNTRAVTTFESAEARLVESRVRTR